VNRIKQYKREVKNAYINNLQNHIDVIKKENSYLKEKIEAMKINHREFFLLKEKQF